MRVFISFLRTAMAELLPAAFVVAGLVAAVTPLGEGFFEGAPYSHAIITSGLAAIVAVLTHRHLPPAVNLILGLAAGTAFLLLVLADPPALVGLPDSWSPIDLWQDAVTGWIDLLASPVPIEVSAELLAFPMAVCWVVAYLTVLLASAARSAVVSAVPLAAATVVFLLLGPGSLSVIAGIVITACMLGHIAARAAKAGVVPDGSVALVEGGSISSVWQYALRSFVLVGIPAVAVAALAGAGLAVATAGDPGRSDFHNSVGPEIDDELTPLSNIRSQLLRSTPLQLFSLTLTGASDAEPAIIDRLRIATLDQYDGALWTAGGVFPPVIRRVRQPDPSNRPTVPITAEINFTSNYETSYLPTIGLLRSVDGPALGLNEDTDTLISGVEPSSLDVLRFTAVVPTGPRPTELSESSPKGVSSDLGDLEVPDQFAEFIAEIVGDVTDPIEGLELLESAMTDEELFGYSVENAYSGHALPVLSNYLSSEKVSTFTIRRQGYAEQGAAAFTILTRMQELPSRVAVGYRLTPDQVADAAGGAEVTVTTDNAHAWSEVYLGDEWVVFDPTNTTERDSVLLERPQVNNSGQGTPRPPQPAQDPPELPVPLAEGRSVPWRLIVGCSVLVGLTVSPIAIKFIRRRRRRNRGDPGDQLAGAWRELRDRLRDRGLPITRSTTPGQLMAFAEAEETEPSFGPPVYVPEVDQFVASVDRGLFAGADPDSDEVSQAWALVPVVARALTSDISRSRRLFGSLDPRSLRRPPIGRPLVSVPATAAVGEEAVIDLRESSDEVETSFSSDPGEPTVVLEESMR